MTNTRRDILTGAVGLTAGLAVPMSAPAAVIEEPGLRADLPFRIEPSANYLELKRLAALMNENHTLRYGKQKLRKAEARRLDKQSQEYWGQIQELLDAIVRAAAAHAVRLTRLRGRRALALNEPRLGFDDRSLLGACGNL